MGCFRYSGNIPKERQIFNASTLSGIEYSLKSLARDDSYNESHTERIGKGILSEADILEMGKIFRSLLIQTQDNISSRVNTLTIHHSQLIPVALQLLKHLQSAGWAYSGASKELNKASNQVLLVLNLIKGLDPSLRTYTLVDAYIRAIWGYYFDDYQICE